MDRFSVHYQLSGDESEAREKAQRVAIDQTVEASEEAIPDGPIREQIVGRLETVRRVEEGCWEAVISYAGELMGSSASQFLNVVFGTSSLKPGIRVAGLQLPEALLSLWRGARFGIDGLRRLAGVVTRPLVCGVLKPLGRTPAELADLAYRLALGGLDLVKDDQGLADQAFCPFEERVSRCAEAVARANRETGRHCRYLPHVTGPWPRLREQALFARRAGAGGLLLCPGLSGYDALYGLAGDGEIAMPILSHPALLGSFIVHREAGIAPAVLFGRLPRLFGADASLYPTHASGFAMTREDAEAIAVAARVPWGHLKPMFPTAAGRMGIERVDEMGRLYGRDVLFVIGSHMHRHPGGLVRACQEFVQQLSRVAGG